MVVYLLNPQPQVILTHINRDTKLHQIDNFSRNLNDAYRFLKRGLKTPKKREQLIIITHRSHTYILFN